MTRRNTYRLLVVLSLCLLQAAGISLYGQERPRAATKRLKNLRQDSIQIVPPVPHEVADTAYRALVADSIAAENRRRMLELTANTTMDAETQASDSISRAISRKQWVPNPTKATWLALVIPGGGQIYNRKYWKLPIFYGGFAGCAYALTWNNKMYKDYTNAYKDAVNEKWDSSNIQDLLPPGYINRVSTSQLTETLRKRKDTYRRYRDMSIFAFIGVYLLSVVDAYVDAELSNFDITPDLSMRVEPAVFNSRSGSHASGKSVGVQCSLRF